MAKLLPVLKSRFTDANGVPLAGGKLYTYVANTSTPQATYTDQTGATPNTNPIILDANGAADIWLNDSFYKFILTDVSDVTILTKDNVSVASDSAASAATSATNATNSATAAAASATAASASSTSAATSASNALTSASNASTSATNAANSATTATTQAGIATTQAGNASTSASGASTSATNAANSATAANTSATNAANSATTAGTNATNAANSATAAGTSATNAANSATAASTNASGASTSATNAANSATAASTSASNASTSTGTATTQAGNASTSATNAANSATAAGTSATNAASSASAAASSAGNILPSSSTIINIGLATSVAANALTIAVKQADGATNCTPSVIGRISFRSATNSSGAFVARDITAALSIVIPSGATLGQPNSGSGFIYVYALDNAGTVELAVSSSPQNDSLVRSTTAIAGGTSLTGFYSSTARANVAIRYLGFVVAGQTTAGVYTANATKVNINSGNIPEYADYVSLTSSTFTSTGSGTYGNVTGNAASLTEGLWELDGTFDINYLSADPLYTYGSCGFYGANGGNSGSAPAALSTLAGLSVLDPNSVATALPMSSTLGYFQGVPVARRCVRVLQPSTVYLVPRVAFTGTATNANGIIVRIFARKISP
jgi:hypothetical protein